MPTLSIIIPTLNEAEYIETCLSRITQNAIRPKDIEIILVDAGSRDATLSLIPKGVQIIYDPNFAGYKYKSLNEGARRAQGRYLLFLDADTLVPEAFDQLISEQLSQEGVVGGAFEFSFDKKLFLLRMIEISNRFRYRVRQTYYGDQGIFVRQDVFEQIGGFPGLRLLEAAHLCKKLRQIGKLSLIKEPIVTSGRRFEQGGILNIFLLDTVIWIKNFLGMNVQSHAKSYWNKT